MNTILITFKNGHYTRYEDWTNYELSKNFIYLYYDYDPHDHAYKREVAFNISEILYFEIDKNNTDGENKDNTIDRTV